MLALNGITVKESANFKEKSIQVKHLVFGAIMCFASAVILCVIGGIIFSFVDVNSKISFVYVITAGYISAAAGGFFAGKKIGVKGFINGIFTGLIYFMMLLCISLLLHSNTELSFSSVLMRGLITMVFSAFGGAVGVNVR